MSTKIMRLVIASMFLVSTGAAADQKAHTEDFEAGKRPKNWGVNFGSWEAENGYLVCRQIEADQHAAASRWQIPLQDGVIEGRVRLSGAKQFHIGFDPARGELDKKGHLYSLIITPNGASLTEHRDKADPASRNMVLATAKLKIPQNEWFDIRLELNGPKVSAKITLPGGSEAVLAAEKDDFRVKKPTVVFRVVGGDVHLDDISVVVAQ